MYQPELQTYLFYGNNDLERIDYYFNNKIINKKLFIKALNSLNNFYLNIYMTWGLGIGDWGLGIGDWGLGIGPNPQSPIPILIILNIFFYFRTIFH